MALDRINRSVSVLSRMLRKCALEAHALVARKAFYCAALSGESEYNICINSDMTVSCNCMDYDGRGSIGDLSREGLAEIFASQKADLFRRRLASGKLAILTCASCHELTRTSRARAASYVSSYSVPTRGLMVENTVRCCYRCASCARSLVEGTRTKLSMEVADVRRVATELAAHRVRTLHFYNLGEPFFADDVHGQLKVIREANPDLKIVISTNGAVLDTEDKRRAAMLADHVTFSIDGVDDDSVRRYQKGASFHKAYGNMKGLVEFRDRLGLGKPAIEWKYVLFNWNDRVGQIRAAVELARQAGVDMISFWPTRSPIYGISWRYRLSGFFRNLGTPSWKGREVAFPRQGAKAEADLPRG